MRHLSILFLIFFIANSLVYAEGYDSCMIKFHANVFKNTSLKFGYYYGSRTFQKDTIHIDNAGYGFYKNILPKGIYFILLPDSSIFEIMIDDGNHFDIEINSIKDKFYFTIIGNPVTEAYNIYQNKILQITNRFDSINEVESNSSDKIVSNKNDKSGKEEKDAIINLQKKTANLFPGSLLESYLKAQIPVEIDSLKKLFPNDSISISTTLYLYRLHYLDNLNLNDERLIYTPIIPEKINYYFEKIISQHPDTIAKEIEKIYLSIENKEVSKFFLASQLEKYRRMKNKAYQEYIYFQMISNIYLQGKTPWESQEQLIKLKKELDKIKPTLINQPAPELNLPGIASAKNNLASIDSDYTLLIFWDIDCPMCQRIIKDINRTVTSFNYLSIKVFTICLNNDFEKWSSYSLKYLPKTWINTIQLTTSGPSETYGISKTPTLYLLDRNKKIIQKNITNAELENIFLNIASDKMIN
jgi:thioredoxin-related protein